VSADQFTLAIGASGHAVVMWIEQPRMLDRASRNSRVWARDHSAADWGAVVALSEPTIFALAGALAVDKDGNAIAVWSQLEMTYSFRWRRFDTATNSWSRSASVVLGPENGGSALRLAFDDAGTGWAVWGGPSTTSPGMAALIAATLPR
jgi:hypothetical protein